MTFKERLEESLGTFGLVLYWILGVVILVVPCLMLKYVWWVKLLLFLAILAFRFLGNLVLYGVWVISFINVLSMPFSIISVLYFVCFGLFVIIQLIPDIIQLIDAIIFNNY